MPPKGSSKRKRSASEEEVVVVESPAKKQKGLSNEAPEVQSKKLPVLPFKREIKKKGWLNFW